jgi:hypothetical protein
MKCRKPLSPKTKKMRPRRYRATVDAIFIAGRTSMKRIYAG